MCARIDGMLAVHVHVHVQPDLVDDFLAASRINARSSLAEEGVLRFDVLQDQADPGHVVLVEVYTGSAAAADHKQTPHYATWRDTVAQMMAVPRESVKFTPVFPTGEQSWAAAG
jgi:(4S)-4-hydroxy-5-phosphonooxypentane-2,3-dione isomerase